MIANVIQSIREEIEAMTSGHFVPYHILSVLVSIIDAIFFNAVFAHNTIYDGKIAVIDLDQSQTSTALIEKLDTSRYIEIASVTHNAVDPTSILMVIVIWACSTSVRILKRTSFGAISR